MNIPFITLSIFCLFGFGMYARSMMVLFVESFQDENSKNNELALKHERNIHRATVLILLSMICMLFT